ncbi:unnamed protein product, partial [Effrenium voratum]
MPHGLCWITEADTAAALPRQHKLSTFLQSDSASLSLPRRLRAEGFSGWFPTTEKRVQPPEGQEEFELQQAEKVEVVKVCFGGLVDFCCTRSASSSLGLDREQAGW